MLFLTICAMEDFPYVAAMDKTDEKADMYLEGIYNTVIVRDIEERQSRPKGNSSKRKINDISLLKTIAKYLSSVVGSPVSVKSVTDYLSSNGRKISANTVDDYMDALAEAFIFYPVERFDLVGKQILKSNKKWYIVDTGLRNYILPRRHYDLGFTLENIVYLELLRCRYRVNIGKYENTEIDFVAQKQGEITYFQVTADMTSEETFQREMRPFTNILGQLSENRPDFRPFFFRKLRWYPGRQCDGLVIRLILIYYILAKRLLPYIFCKITAFLHSKSLTLNFSKEISR